MAENKPDGPICASHTRQRWNIDRSTLGWHRWCLFEERPWLRWVIPIVLTVVVIAILITGIVVTVEYYTAYYTSGVWVLDNERNETVNPVAMQTSGALRTVDSVSSSPPLSVEEPLRVCGDQQRGCAKYDQSNICCSVGQACFATDFTASGVFCCADSSNCSSSLKQPAVCPGHMYQCDSTVGGGCCASGSECSSIGCLLRAKLMDPTFSGDATVTITATVAATAYKYGEITQSQGISQATTGVWSPFRLSGQPTCQAMKPVVAVLLVWMIILFS